MQRQGLAVTASELRFLGIRQWTLVSTKYWEFLDHLERLLPS